MTDQIPAGRSRYLIRVFAALLRLTLRLDDNMIPAFRPAEASMSISAILESRVEDLETLVQST